FPRVISAIVISGKALGKAFSLSHRLCQNQITAAQLFKLLMRETCLNFSITNSIYSIRHFQENLVCNNAMPSLQEHLKKGGLKFMNCKFTYPTRTDIQVLHGLLVSLKPGQNLTFVGSSGYRKSTSVQLWERFYDLDEGRLIDGCPSHTVNVPFLKAQISIVSQEPVLFDCGIAENIQHDDNTRNVSMVEIVEAAKKAHLQYFVMTLPDVSSVTEIVLSFVILLCHNIPLHFVLWRMSKMNILLWWEHVIIF
ncbi:bile salt export pump-like, partial [Oncorhynchus mykiss]|uniref:bile salt export pump-like n=1 Tax=Oncorhynchus mykiss TaxID=8022 RepID=UPI0018777167